jgi:YVTN family beta-propeller protein
LVFAYVCAPFTTFIKNKLDASTFGVRITDSWTVSIIHSMPEASSMQRRLLLVASLGVVLVPFWPLSGQDKDKPTYAGPTDKGFLLPNGWTLTPAGKHVALTDLPLNIIPLADGKHALVATSGYNQHQLSLVDLADPKIVDQQTVKQSWFGLAVAADGGTVCWSGGGAAMLHTFSLQSGKLKRTSPDEPETAKLPKKEVAALKEKLTQGFRSGLWLDDKDGRVYSLHINQGGIAAIDLKTGTAGPVAKIGGRPYDVAMSRSRTQLFISDWAGRCVLVLDPKELRVVAKIPVGEHPNQLATHPKDDRLFVACASSNCVSVIDTKRGIVTETIYTALFPRAPEGSTPDALAVAPDGKMLYVANADNNCVAVIDIRAQDKSQVVGFIPTGWYPTSVAVTPESKTLLVGVGKGLQTKANPIYKEAKKDKQPDKDEPGETRPKLPYPYIGTTLSGALSVVAVPDEKQLASYTAAVYRNCPYSDALLTGVPSKQKTVIPTKVGDPSPIKYVIYIIRENRTYDQVFGDLKEGNGDPALVMFGESVTPNAHKLAREYVLLDNLYCNGQVSRDGHPWSTMAYHTDYIARDWHLTYSRRLGVADDQEGNLAKGPSGYLWDACARNGLSYRSYGEYGKRVSEDDGNVKMEAAVPGLIGHICPDYGVPRVKGQKVRDTDNVETFLKEYHQFEKAGTMPRFIVMSLGEDHTQGTTPGANTPAACVASNDLALGRLVEAVTRSKLWPQTAIFVIEDDAQNGPDHVDAHRTVGLVISPYTKRKFVDSTQYSTVSMIRTMELILGMPPLSQYDAAARPMFNSFLTQPDLTAYTHEAARIDVSATNPKNAYGAERSAKMDFSDYDLVDDFELNEILWRSIKGVDAPLPPAVRRAIADRPLAVERK